ncbi:hypothetical protein BG015_009997 [Linnemannia schmuckeri]|uniref:Uncharacterized protein n=1 Tax=Linnemannia schmuckeri TaxID=64567 RepID=A0A9P5RY49_9FUNG|nr:hypothetical protein BG015_009997 [Linnemannia schmuckeri]
MHTSSSTNKIQPDMEHGPHSAEQKQYQHQQEQQRSDHQQEQEQEHVELPHVTNQRHLARQQRIAELREKRLSMSSIMTVDTSLSSIAKGGGGGFFTCSSPTTAASSSCTSPMMPAPTIPSSLTLVSFQDNYPTNNGSNYRHSRRTSSSVSSSLSEWHHFAHSNNFLPSNPAFPAPMPAPAPRRQQQQSTKHKSQTSELDGPLPFPSRPNSFASSYQPPPAVLSRKNSQRSQQQRQLDPGTATMDLTNHKSNNNNQYEKESNAAFERICSLLNHLITDASTAVSTADGKDSSGAAAVIPPIVIPRYLPMVCSESENSDEEGGEEASYLEGGEAMATMDDIDGGASIFFDEAESPRDQIRRRIDDSRKKRLARNRTGSYTTDPSKRASLFLELQNLQVESEGTQHPTTPVLAYPDVDAEGSRHHRTSSNMLSPGLGRTSMDAAMTSMLLSPTTSSSRSLDFELFDSELGSPITLTTPRRRASFPPRRSDRIQIQRAEELQRVIQRVDAELDRTVETIDDLTRDLVAVATHQNWMKTHLERTLGIQSPLSLVNILQKDDDMPFTMAGVTEGNPMSPTSSASPRGRFEQMEDIIGVTKALLSSKEFTNYCQVLERVRIMEQEDCKNDYERDDGDGEGSDLFGNRIDTSTNLQRLSGSSFTLTNGSFRHSASSTLSLETRFGSYVDFKDGAPLTSSSRPSIEWSDRVGMTQYSSGHGLIQETIHPLVAPTSVHLQQQQQHQGLGSPSEPLSDREQEAMDEQLSKQEPELLQQGREQQVLTDLNTLLRQAGGKEDHFSPDTTLAIDKLILTCTHLFLLVFCSLALFLGVIITDGFILDNAGRQLITSVEVLQSHFTIRDNDTLLAEQVRDGDATQKQDQEKEKEKEQVAAAAVAESAPKSSRPCSTRRRTRPSQRYHSHTHHHHKHLHRRGLSSIFPQISASDVIGGSNIGGRFYNSPFLASSRYGVDISHKEPRAIQLGPLAVVPAPAPMHGSTNTKEAATMLAPVLPASLSASCPSTVGLFEDSELSISTASSSATLLDWLDATAANTTTINTAKKEALALMTAHNNIDPTTSSCLSSETATTVPH